MVDTPSTAETVDVDAERKTIAKERHRAPVIAAAVTQVGMLVACLTPLLLAAYLIHTLRYASDDDADLAELLVTEFAAEQPRLLPQIDRPMLPGANSSDTEGSNALTES